MQNETIVLEVGGEEMKAYVARPEGTAVAGIMVFQEAFGVNRSMSSVADRFASEGYLAIAPQLFHRTGQDVEVDYTDFGAARPHMDALTTEGLEADAKASYDWLVAQGCEKIVAIGFCLGGRVSYIANSSLPLAAAVSFYGAGIAPALLDRAQNLSGPTLFFWGGKDTHITQEVWGQVSAAINAAGKDQITVEMGQADHGFFNADRTAYHEPSARIAWPLVLTFLSQKIAG